MRETTATSIGCEGQGEPGTLVHLSERYRLITVSPRPDDLFPLACVANDAVVLSCEEGRSLADDAPAVAHLSLEQRSEVRKRWGATDIDLLPSLFNEVRNGCAQEPMIVVPYVATKAWENTAQRHPYRIRIAAPASGLVRRLSYKTVMRRMFHDHDIPTPRSLVLRHEQITYEEAVEAVGTPFVLQTPVGSAGRGTYLVASRSDLRQVLARPSSHQTWLLSAFAGERTVNLHGVVYADGVYVSRPSLQISGIAELGATFGQYCGSDFAAASGLPHAVQESGYRIAARIGWLLGRFGYRGMFGIDCALSDRSLAVLEVNPRVQASSAALSAAEQAAGERPILLRHLDAVLGHRLGSISVRSRIILRTTHMVLRSVHGDRTVEHSPAPGRYVLADGRISPVTASACTAENHRPHIVKLSGTPRHDTRICHGATLARITTADLPLTDPTGTALHPRGRALVDALQASFVWRSPCLTTKRRADTHSSLAGVVVRAELLDGDRVIEDRLQHPFGGYTP